MIFNTLSLFQNILFVISCVSILLLIAYLILFYSGYIRPKNKIVSDDIDDNTDNYDKSGGVFLNAFTIKGSIFGLAIISTGSFMLSLYMSLWLAILISVVVGIVLVFMTGYLDREPLVEGGEDAIVSETIPEKRSGTGKVILLNNNAEIDAETNEDEIKKGKKVIIIENNGNKVIVRRYKKHSK